MLEKLHCQNQSLMEYLKKVQLTICFNRYGRGKISMKLSVLNGKTGFRESWKKNCRNFDAIIFVVDQDDQSNYQRLNSNNIAFARAQIHELLQNKSLTEIPLLVLGNKNDLAGSLKQEELIDKMGLSDVKQRTIACFSVSAKSQNRLYVMLQRFSQLDRNK